MASALLNENYIPEGLLYDLEDNSPTEIIFSIPENIAGFTTEMMFNALEEDVNTVRKFRDRLKELHLDDTSNSEADFNNCVRVLIFSIEFILKLGLMKVIHIYLCLFFVFSSCIREELELLSPSTDPEPPCEHQLFRPYHCLEVPVHITPHQEVYYLGDTIEFGFYMTDSIFDYGTLKTFKIEDFPFRPDIALYRYEGVFFDWEAGFRVNELLIDSVYNHTYLPSTQRADWFYAESIYENGYYKFEFQIVLETEGKYIILFSDLYNENEYTGSDALNAEADSISFEGKCDNIDYFVANIVQGDDQNDLFIPELQHLDEEIFRNALSSRENEVGSLRTGAIAIEENGFFSFRVRD